MDFRMLRKVSIFVTLLIFFPLLSHGALTDGLVAYYPFNGNANDTSGNVNHGTVYGATLTTDRFGNANSAYYFDGVNDYIECADSSSLDLSGPASFFAWVWINSLTGNSDNNIIINKDDLPNTSDYRPYEMGIHDQEAGIPRGNLAFYIGGVVGLPSHQAGWVNGGGPVLQQQWVFVGMTYDGSYVKTYINGSLQKSYSVTGLIYQNNLPLRIGARQFHNDGGAFLNGAIDEVRIYNRALSNDEIQGLYDLVAPPVPTTAPSVTYYPEPKDLFTSKTVTFITEHTSEFSTSSRVYIQSNQNAAQGYIYKPLNSTWKDTFNTMSSFSSLISTGMSLTATAISSVDPLMGLINLGIYTGKDDVLSFLHLENSAKARVFLDSAILILKTGTGFTPLIRETFLLSLNAIIYKQLSLGLATLANDPPDLNYTEVYQAPIFHGGPINFTGISPELNTLLGLQLDSVHNTHSYLYGLTTTINRYGSALSAGDAISAGLQFQAFLKYLGLYDASAIETANYLNQVQQMLKSLGVQDSTYNVQSILYLQNYLTANGLSPDLNSFYLSLGLSQADITSLVQSMLSYSPTTNMDVSLYSSLTSMNNILLTVSSSPPISGDFTSPSDCDVDGSDLANLLANPGWLDVTSFAQNFGKNACQ